MINTLKKKRRLTRKAHEPRLLEGSGWFALLVDALYYCWASDGPGIGLPAYLLGPWSGAVEKYSLEAHRSRPALAIADNTQPGRTESEDRDKRPWELRLMDTALKQLTVPLS